MEKIVLGDRITGVVVSGIRGCKAVVEDPPGKGGHFVSEKSRAPEDEQPLAKPVREQEPTRSVSGDSDESTRPEKSSRKLLGRRKNRQ
jgi:hypothetical protein